MKNTIIHWTKCRHSLFWSNLLRVKVFGSPTPPIFPTEIAKGLGISLVFSEGTCDTDLKVNVNFLSGNAEIICPLHVTTKRRRFLIAYAIGLIIMEGNHRNIHDMMKHTHAYGYALDLLMPADFFSYRKKMNDRETR